MIEAIVFAFLIAILNQINTIPTLTLPTMIPIYIATIMYIMAHILLIFKPHVFIKYTWTITIFPIVSVIYFTIRYSLYVHFAIGIVLVLLGILLNQIVVKMNNGKMPMFYSLSYCSKVMTDNMKNIDIFPYHEIGNENTKLIPLSDIFDFGYNVFSLGDFCIFSVFGIVMYGVICRLG